MSAHESGISRSLQHGTSAPQRACAPVRRRISGDCGASGRPSGRPHRPADRRSPRGIRFSCRKGAAQTEARIPRIHRKPAGTTRSPLSRADTFGDARQGKTGVWRPRTARGTCHSARFLPRRHIPPTRPADRMPLSPVRRYHGMAVRTHCRGILLVAGAHAGARRFGRGRSIGGPATDLDTPLDGAV